MVRYVRDRSLEEYVRRLGEEAGLRHIDYSRVRCVRSFGSRSRSVAARIHAASRALYTGLGIRPVYVIEFVSEVFEKLTRRERDRVVLHELLHIPASMGGGLVGHGALDFEEEVERLERRISR
ncbi:MAG: putative metallopeptidase [Candidatus Caldarchaeales archaeon]|nr:putative metallopeptidase [Candidatus Caldarchaeales archaeon]MDT7914981.1 putative metallopeptidase [Candidatus Caldarchaeales archaeon]